MTRRRHGASPVSDAEALCSPDTYARGVPHGRLERLRERIPVVWLAEGSWAVLRYADVRRALSHPELFAPEIAEPPHGPTALEERGRAAHPAPAGPAGPADAPIDMDPPAAALVDRLVQAGEEGVDFVTQVAPDLPETVRNTLAGGLCALVRHPRELALLRERSGGDPAAFAALLDSAVEEVMRWWTPVLRVPRTVRRATSLGGVPLLPGERASLWLASANHDATAFPDPERFAADRFLRGAPAHLGFGHGARACLGRRLARVHLHAFLTEIVFRPGRPGFAGEPLPLRSSARHGFERLPVRWTG
ncbi:cytochrome P450 [Actinomadura kijaniata]|uniref:cytochrome P450 n=1 Tax=Actinomadura kijaniata TaxID=46161 RepID=UPI0008352C66|nr:cytochrome P450 [Actinomadura kijaniata]